MAEKRLDIVVAARDEASRVFRDASAQLDQFRANLSRTAQQERQAYEARSDRLRQDIERRAAAASAGADRTLGETNTLLLEKQAALGDNIARNTLEQLRLESRQATERSQLLAITRNTLTTEQQRVAAQQQLVKLDQLHAKERAALAAAQAAAAMPQAGEATAAAPTASKGNSIKDALKDLKEFNKNARLLIGGGELAIFDVLGHKLADVIGKSRELFKEWGDGKIKFSELASELGKGLPVVGGFFEAGQSIRAWADGSAKALDEAKAKIASADEWNRRLDKQIAARKDLNDITSSSGRDAELAGLDNSSRQRRQADFALEDQIKKIRESVRNTGGTDDGFKAEAAARAAHAAKLKAIDEDEAKERADLQAQVMQGQLEAEGKHSEAVLAEIKSRYSKLIAATGDGKKKEALAALQLREEARERKRAADEVADLMTSVRQGELEAEGRHGEAMVQAIRDRYRKEIAATGDWKKKILLLTLGLQEEQKAAKEQNLRLGDLDAQIEENRLRAAGRLLDAHLLEIRQKYKQRLADAGSNDEREKLKVLQGQEEDQARKDAGQYQRGPSQSAVLSTDYLDIASRFKSGSEVKDPFTKETATYAKKMDERLKQTNEAIKALAEAIRAGAGNLNGIALGVA